MMMEVRESRGVARSAKKLMVEPSATVGLSLSSTANHDVSCDSLVTVSEFSALKPWLVRPVTVALHPKALARFRATPLRSLREGTPNAPCLKSERPSRSTPFLTALISFSCCRKHGLRNSKMDHFRNSVSPVEKCLNVHGVVLVGDSTRIPIAQKMIQEFINGRNPCPTPLRQTSSLRVDRTRLVC